MDSSNGRDPREETTAVRKTATVGPIATQERIGTSKESKG
jgi:hypothetical protein